MIELAVDLWQVNVDARCITTNGTVRPDGTNVMGGGCALEAARRYPELPFSYGWTISEQGNEVFPFDTSDGPLVMFPVKHDVSQRADVELIRRSVGQLVALADFEGWERVALPRPGCGLGGLSWDDVRPILEPLLDDRFIIIDFPKATA